MKRIFILIFGLFFVTYNCSAQQKPKHLPGKTIPQYTRCGTEKRVQMLFKVFPERKLLAEKLAKEMPSANMLRVPQRLQSIVYIPVVFHIILPNPYVITDSVVQSQIDELNTDFAGLNADSTNVPAAFETVRGHSMIQFVLAKRTPSGALTNGIDRVSSSTNSDPANIVDSIKRTALGGADAWDPTSYANIWVGNGSGESTGILGYTQIPGSGVPADDGIFCNVVSFGISNCNISEYNKARTVVHEMGHYFGLFHIWGDDENDANKCSGDDFRALTDEGSTYTLPLSLYNPDGQGNTALDIGDTPNQAIATTNCPSGTVTDACSTAAPGIIYQDFMDYTMDDCYSMFTKKQVARMEYVLETYRTGLETSLGATPPTGAVTRDASPILPINPGGYENSGCNSIYHPSALTCAGNITPEVLIQNKGLNTITSITVGYTLNGGSPVTINLNPNLSTDATQMVSFPSVLVSTGTSTFKFFSSNVNGIGADQVPSNDTLSVPFTVSNPMPLPVSEGFESGTFPPSGWSIINPDNNNTWQTTIPGNNSAHSIFIDNYDNNVTGQIDEIRTPKLLLSGTDPVVISFDLANKNYPDPAYNDSLQVLVSNDCGATFTTYFNKGGAALATAGSSSDAYLNPAPGDWETQKITVDGPILNGGNIIVAFRNISDYGNNIYLDNINISQEKSRDIMVTTVNPPSTTDCVEPNIPVAIVKNVGFSTITGFNVSYMIDNGAPLQTIVTGVSLAPDAQMNVPLNTFTPTLGQHVITVYSANPISSDGTGDENVLNDTIRKSFFVLGTINPPDSEGFEDAVFPPPTWAIENPGGGITWERSTAAAKTGSASMVIKNFESTEAGTTNDFISSVISGTPAYDSMYVSFDYAYATGILAGLSDTLELQVTTDCGQTFTTIWKNWGTNLQTASNSPGTEFVPTANEWAHVNINLSNYLGSQDFQVYFVAKSNQQNDLYIDNINIYGITVPARLKQQGYLIYPNPFTQQFIIRNYQVPVTLQSAHIYNSVGQLIWSKEYNGNGYTEMPVDLGNAPAGVYFLKLQYTDRAVVQKIVKESQ
ncbi:MAG TPA: choice-of-anchor J domain-containing protein [Hanamia sp.]|nr:choice-of-anchor J domain-containing protein [Hanamia sp.]